MTTYKHASDIDRIHELEREVARLRSARDNWKIAARIAQDDKADAEAHWQAICMWLAIATISAIGLLVALARGWWQ